MHFLIFLPFLLISCAHKDTKKSNKPKYYFDKAVQYKEDKNYIKALENLTELRKNFFYSSYNQKAVLLTGDVYFAQEKYSNAAKSYEKHLKLYPRKETDYVLYQIGLSYKEQLPKRSEHDLSLAEPALKVFEKLLNLKADSPYKEKAKIEKQKILDKKASKELKAILFYKTQGWDKAAFKRVEFFIKTYPKSPLMPKALLEGFRLAHILNKDSEAFKKNLIENYPDSEERKLINKKIKDSTFSKWKKKLL